MWDARELSQHLLCALQGPVSGSGVAHSSCSRNTPGANEGSSTSSQKRSKSTRLALILHTDTPCLNKSSSFKTLFTFILRRYERRWVHATGTCIGQKATLLSFLFSVVRSHCGALVDPEFTTMSKISQIRLLLLPNAGVRGVCHHTSSS